MDNHTAEQRRKNMSAVKSKDTVIEKILRKALWSKGFRYRKNYQKLPGKPDIVLTKYKIAIFCDSDFWHGKDYNEKTFMNTKNKDFWELKIKRNIERDKEVNDLLIQEGYKVLRFSEKQIKSNINICIDLIKMSIEEKK